MAVQAKQVTKVKDLMTLYNLRTSGRTTGQILVRVIAQAYLAGEMQDVSETFVGTMADGIKEHVGNIGAGLLKFVGSKIGEGVVNGLLIKRLGNATIDLLRPV